MRAGFAKQIWQLLQEQLFTTPSTTTLFNPYTGCHEQADLPNGDQIRRENLLNYLASFRQPPAVVIIGEALGWRGGRFSGVPFASEAQLCQGQLPFPGQRSSRQGAPYRESSATIFWRHLFPYHPRFLAWNCMPLHPHRSKDPWSNRTPNQGEIAAFSELLAALLRRINPVRVLALGRTAERTLRRIGIPATYVRHPSHGGAVAFGNAIEALWAANQSAV